MKYYVDIIESEAGWGQKIEEVRVFDSKDFHGNNLMAKDAATAFVQKYNKPNNKKKVPTWYMYATLRI